MDTLFALFSTRSLIKLIVVPIMLCLTINIASAQLEFSNFIVGKNTIMHIELDGTTSLVTHNGITGDGYHYIFHSLLSDNNGNPLVKLGRKYYRDKNGTAASNGVCSLNYFNEDSISENDAGIWTPPPFMLKSPDNKYSYIIHSSFTYKWEYNSEIDSLIRTGKAQIRCFCKNIFDNTDKGKDFIIHEYTNIAYFKDIIYGSTIGGDQDRDFELPFFAGMSHTDGKSIWVITKSSYEDSVVAINLNGSSIISKKKSYLHLEKDDYWGTTVNIANYNVTDNGKIYAKVPNQPKTLCISFDQDRGSITGLCFYNIKAESKLVDISTTGKYFYHTRVVSNSPKRNELVRIKISDIENGIYNTEVINSTQPVDNENYSTIRIGIDGNIYVRNGKSMMIVYDSETDNPRFETLYTDADIPDSDINFPNYLYTYELFACNSDCDRNATFSFPDPRNEIIAYEWDFGDGSTSTDASPTHKYSQTGIYTVSLKVTLKNGHIKTVPTRKISILDHKASATFNNAIVCHGEPLKISLTGNAPYQIFYTFNGEEQTITTSDTEFTLPQAPGKYTITKIKNAYCETKPNKDNTAEILPQLNNLNIIKE